MTEHEVNKIRALRHLPRRQLLTWIIPDRMRRLSSTLSRLTILKLASGCEPGLGRDHAPEPGDGPGPDVVVLGAGRDEELLREGDLVTGLRWTVNVWNS